MELNLEQIIALVKEVLPPEVEISNVSTSGPTKVSITLLRQLENDDLDLGREDFGEDGCLLPEVCDKIANDFAADMGELLKPVESKLEDIKLEVVPNGFSGSVCLSFDDGTLSDHFAYNSNLQVLAETVAYKVGEYLEPEEDAAKLDYTNLELSKDDLADEVPEAEVEIAPIASEEPERPDMNEEPFDEGIDFKALAEKYLGPDEDEQDEIAAKLKDYEDEKYASDLYDSAYENLEDEAACADCFAVYPKSKMIKTRLGYLCPVCDQERKSHQGTNLDLVDKDPFDLDYDDPRLPKEQEVPEVVSEPFDAKAERAHEEGIDEELKVIKDFGDYEPWSGAEDTYNKIKDAGKLEELEAWLEEIFPDGATETEINDVLWFEPRECFIACGLDSEDGSSEDVFDQDFDEGYKGTPEERTTHLEYTDDDPADGKAVLPDNIEKQLTEDKDVDYVEYMHSYCNALEPHMDELRKIDNVEELKKAILNIVGKDPDVNPTEKKNKFVWLIQNKKWSSPANIMAYLDKAMAKAKSIEVKVDDNGELVKQESLEEDVNEKPWMWQQGEDGEPEFIGWAKSYNELLKKLVKNRMSDYIYESTYIDELDKDTYEYIKKDLSDDEVKELDKYFGIGESLEEHINDRPADIESDQELQGIDNAVVNCKKYTLVAHSEDEKPVDCKLEKPALEEPVAGEKVDGKFYEELNEAKKDEDEIPPDPEVVKLEVHQELNNLVADEIEAIDGYEEVKADILDKPIEHKDEIVDTINHIEDEEKEHIDELVNVTQEIPFSEGESSKEAEEEKEEEPVIEPANEDPFDQDFPVNESKALQEVAAELPFDSEAKVGDSILIVNMEGEPDYCGRKGKIEHIDSLGQLHGTWGGCAVIPGVDEYDILTDESLEEDAKAPKYKAVVSWTGTFCGDKRVYKNDRFHTYDFDHEPTEQEVADKFYNDPTVIRLKNWKVNHVRKEVRDFMDGVYDNEDGWKDIKLTGFKLIREDLNEDFDDEDTFTPEEQEEYDCDEEGYDNNGYNRWRHCAFCKQVWEENELRLEADLGLLCPDCINELKSRGETLEFIESLKEAGSAKTKALNENKENLNEDATVKYAIGYCFWDYGWYEALVEKNSKGKECITNHRDNYFGNKYDGRTFDSVEACIAEVNANVEKYAPLTYPENIDYAGGRKNGSLYAIGLNEAQDGFVSRTIIFDCKAHKLIPHKE